MTYVYIAIFQNSEHFDSSDISNNLMLKTPLTCNVPNCSTILYYPHCNVKFVNIYFFILFVIFFTCIGCTGFSCTKNCLTENS